MEERTGAPLQPLTEEIPREKSLPFPGTDRRLYNPSMATDPNTCEHCAELEQSLARSRQLHDATCFTDPATLRGRMEQLRRRWEGEAARLRLSAQEAQLEDMVRAVSLKRRAQEYEDRGRELRAALDAV